MNISFEIGDLDFGKPIDDVAKEHGAGKETMLFLANEAKRLMDPYVPMDHGTLSTNVRTTASDGEGIVEYNSPYAHYLYEGILYVDPVTGAGGFFIDGVGWRSRKSVHKVPSGKRLNIQHFRHPLATTKWDEAMMAARGKELTAAVEKFAGGK